MKEKRLLLVSLIASVLLLVGVFVGLVYAQGQAAQVELSTQAASLATAFTYQGQLKDTTGSVTDDCQMAFRLYDGADAGTQAGDAITTTVPITDGLFTVRLDFGAVFTGTARWLDVKVRCPGDSAYADLGRQELTTTPYSQYSLDADRLDGRDSTSFVTIFDAYIGDDANPAPMPIVVDLTTLGVVDPADVVVHASAVKWTGAQVTPALVVWQVSGPPFVASILVYDENGTLYDQGQADWTGTELHISFSIGKRQ